MAESYGFIDGSGTFQLERAENYSYLYFPVAGENGIKSALTPNLGGDCKLDQNTFLTEPVSAENLHSNRGSRNFWCHMEGLGSWSAAGTSAWQLAEKFTESQDESGITAGPGWHRASRSSRRFGLGARITSFVPLREPLEVMYVEITNESGERREFIPTAAIPLYGRSADNIRDHRHVTSLLHRIRTLPEGVAVTPTLSFDERGHRINGTVYFVCGFDGNGNTPETFYPISEDFIGEGGTFESPRAVLENRKGVEAGEEFAGFEAVGGLRFGRVSLEPGERACFTVLMGAADAGEDTAAAVRGLISGFRTKERTLTELARVKEYWEEKINVSFHTGDKVFDGFMHWVCFQPMLRRIYGCSFLPHHDYGRGGRGWRDLWQDCLALLIMDPGSVRRMLLDNFCGVRMDGTNATIIGSRPGEFIADRNHIARVWMDHGVWPFMTTKLYIDQTGDLGILAEERPYFKDGLGARGAAADEAWDERYGTLQRTAAGEIYEGSVLEHLLAQNLTAFYEVGEHNHIRLRDADWNDALDMAQERGESVAFTNAYAGNLRELARLLEAWAERVQSDQAERVQSDQADQTERVRSERTERDEGRSAGADGPAVFLAEELFPLLEEEPALYDSVKGKLELLGAYTLSCLHRVSGRKKEISLLRLAENLLRKADWLADHIRRTEWVGDREGNGWFNGYYDDHGKRVEGTDGRGVRMMLTSQVFAVMAGTASEEQISRITKSADRYLYREAAGGYCLNTDFGEVKTDLGRMFGFAYGEKENGAVFSHMAVMYANALYSRGFAKEGFKALDALEKQAVDFEKSRIYPGIPEYFNSRGRGVYHYLTGAASWYMLTVVTQAFGVRGSLGDLALEPKLMDSQFDGDGKASLALPFAGKRFRVVYENKRRVPYGKYRIAGVRLDGKILLTYGEPAEGKALSAQKDLPAYQEAVFGDKRSLVGAAALEKEGRAARIGAELMRCLTDEEHELYVRLEPS